MTKFEKTSSLTRRPGRYVNPPTAVAVPVAGSTPTAVTVPHDVAIARSRSAVIVPYPSR